MGYGGLHMVGEEIVTFTHLALIIILGVKEYIFEDADSK